ncbi:fatty acyl-AMP ligase [Mycolicibacterium sp. HK-90]|uniref:fatty acyl-AMP ligase n=1 Tax=Mycolicibacterium sp. HK-90 TaxID=3056937 RepID=UPI0026595EE8|nr:fatty acyl-AMP ligase [Mycolicibacterium sp. HK-90]WKG02914.1 fatty acyl-AMP ligase [Mycolicibacterium sp. HK-90]
MNRILSRLHAGAEITSRGLTTAPVDADGRSRLDQLTTATWAQVHHAGRDIAGGLQRAGVLPGDAVAVLAGAPGEIAPLVQGIWMSGAAVTMLHHPTHRTDIAEWAADLNPTLSAIGASTVVVGSPFLSAVEALSAAGVRTVLLSELLDGPPGQTVDSDEDAIAFQQLTSGSTGRPKAVAISYRNIEANLVGMAAASAADAETDVVVSWLPLFHDMGMMGYLITPMCLGIETVKVTPVDFLGDPLLWAELITRYRGTMTAAPNFAYSVLARRLGKAADGAYDLSTMRFALSGAEAIDVATLDRLTAAGARFGLRKHAMVPAYGMAEATLGVSFVRPGDGYRVCAPHPDLVAGQGDSAQRVALGPPLPGCQVRVVAEDGSVVESPAIGELEIRGDNVTRGYRTAEGIEAVTDADGWFRTGDLGYLTDDGQPVICGRKKDILIISGRNVHPEDIERSVAGVTGVRSGGVAAVRLSAAAAGEGFSMVAESALHADSTETARIRAEIADRIYRRLGLSPRTVHVVPAGWLPKTSSGKLRRSETTARLARLGHPGERELVR